MSRYTMQFGTPYTKLCCKITPDIQVIYTEGKKEIFTTLTLNVYIWLWLSMYDLIILNCLYTNERNMVSKGDSFH